MTCWCINVAETSDASRRRFSFPSDWAS